MTASETSSRPELRREGQAFIFEHQGLRAEFSQLRQEGGGQYGGLNGEVRITCGLPGVQPHLHEARINLSSTNARQTLVRQLAKRGGEVLSELQIDDFVEYACVLTMRAFREGEPFLNLAEVDFQPPDFAVGNLFPLNKRCQVFAPAENLKTTLMMAFLQDIATGDPQLGFPATEGAVGLLDWETDSNDATNLWHRIAQGRGLTAPPPLFYRRCRGPIWFEAESAARLFQREGVVACVLDSAFWACGGNPNSQENVGQMFQGIDGLGELTAILLNHTGSDQADKTRRRHYGLEHFRNAVRASWELRRADVPGKPDVINLGLYRDKLNMRRKEGPFGFEVFYDGDDGPIFVQRRDEAVVESAELDESRPAGDRIYDALTHGRATIQQLCEELNLSAGTIKSAVSRMRGRIRTRKDGKTSYYELVAEESRFIQERYDLAN